MEQEKDTKAVNEETEDVNKAAEETEETTTSQEPQEENEEPTLDEKLAAAQKEIEQLKDKYLRQVAEFDNYRKRMLKEKTNLILNGGEKVLTALLPVLDDLERAADNIGKSNEIATLKEGVSLIIDKLTKTLIAQGLKKMEPIGTAFDTDFHEAVALVPAQDEKQKGNVVDCVQAGYLLNDKVIRHAKVVVGQ